MREELLRKSKSHVADEKLVAALKFCVLGQMECSHLAGAQPRAKYTQGVATSEALAADPADPWGAIVLFHSNQCLCFIASEGPGCSGDTCGHDLQPLQISVV